MKRNYPRTREEAFSMLDAVLASECVKFENATEIDEYILDAHFGLGLWIRNSWLYGKHGGEVANLFMTTHLSTWPADIVSSEILSQYAAYLKEKWRK